MQTSPIEPEPRASSDPPESRDGAESKDQGDALARRLRQAREVVEIEADAVGRLVDRLGPEFGRAVDRILACPGQVVVTGMGKAGLVGAKISATLASTGTPSVTLHPGEALHGDLGRLRSEDVLLALSNSGETAEIKAMIPAARRIGSGVISITETRTSTLGRLSDLVLEIGPVSEACPLGMAPTASTTAMLALGDALAMVVLSERGFGREDFAQFHPAGALGRKLARVEEVMRMGEELPIAPVESSFGEVLRVASQTPGRPGAVLLTSKDGLLRGIFTDGDLRRVLLSSDGNVREIPIEQCMGRDPKTIQPGKLVEEALHLINKYKIDQLPVVDPDGRPVGLLDVQDVLDLKL